MKKETPTNVNNAIAKARYVMGRKMDEQEKWSDVPTNIKPLCARTKKNPKTLLLLHQEKRKDVGTKIEEKWRVVKENIIRERWGVEAKVQSLPMQLH